MQDGSCVRNVQCFPDWIECPHSQVNAVGSMPKLQATKAQEALESNPDVTHTSLSQQGEATLVLLLQNHRAKMACVRDGHTLVIYVKQWRSKAFPQCQICCAYCRFKFKRPNLFRTDFCLWLLQIPIK
jgi:hypothetical protein